MKRVLLHRLKKEQEVENLVIVGDNKDWSLIATGEIDNNLEGLLGYLITDCLGELGGMDAIQIVLVLFQVVKNFYNFSKMG